MMDQSGQPVHPESGDPFTAAVVISELLLTPPKMFCPHPERPRWRVCSDPDLMLCEQCWRMTELIAALNEPEEYVRAISCCCCCGCSAQGCEVQTVDLVRWARLTVCLTCESAVADALEDLVRGSR